MIEVKGANAIVAGFAENKKTTIAGMTRGLKIEAERIMAESKNVYCPVVSGNLKSSGHVDPAPTQTGDSIEISLNYGGPAAPYALEVHEAPHSRGQHKDHYLSKPLMKNAKDFVSRIGAWARI